MFSDTDFISRSLEKLSNKSILLILLSLNESEKNLTELQKDTQLSPEELKKQLKYLQDMHEVTLAHSKYSITYTGESGKMSMFITSLDDLYENHLYHQQKEK